jgi:hypothetical protein
MSKKMVVNGFKGLVAVGLVGMLAACGGSGGGSSDSDEVSSLVSESIVARGVITQLGSIWVLGVEYETPNGGSYSNDDDVSDEAHYEVGQWVRIRGKRHDDGVSGIADEVEYEAEIEGVADANGDINGVVIVRAANINAPGIPDPLNPGSRYEVSGIWLDNFTIEEMEQAVGINKNRIQLEASGNITDQTLLRIAETGVDFISIGALTKHLRAIDFSLRFI